MIKLLLVDDEQRMLDLLSLYLQPYGYHCKKVQSGIEAIEAISNSTFDLILLDVMMPEMDGWETCRRIREFSDIPIIMVTARDQRHDMVKGLQLGSDDYIPKPFHEDILVARVQTVLRRSNKNTNKQFKDIEIDNQKHIVVVNNKTLTLTPIEFKLLDIFIENIDFVLSREHLIEKIWGYSSETEDRTVDSHIRNLRDKLRKSGFAVDGYLKTVYGVGYKWQASENG
jgi:DNA-binding response OmpR family regulator